VVSVVNVNIKLIMFGVDNYDMIITL